MNDDVDENDQGNKADQKGQDDQSAS